MQAKNSFNTQICKIDEQKVSDMIDDICKVPQLTEEQEKKLQCAQITPSQLKYDKYASEQLTGRQTNKENYQANSKQPVMKKKGRPPSTKQTSAERSQSSAVQHAQPQDLKQESSKPQAHRQPLKQIDNKQ